MVTEEERAAVRADIEKMRAADSGKQESVDRVVSRLVSSEPRAREIEFKVGGIFSSVNAYADGRKRIFVSPQMMRFVKGDDELAFVLSHEMVHALHGHHARAGFGRVFTAAAGAAAGAYADRYADGSGALVSPVVDAAAWAPFSKDMEMEADAAAVGYMRAAGYDPSAGLAVLKRFAVEIPPSRNATIVSTHPASPDRLSRLQTLLEGGSH